MSNEPRHELDDLKGERNYRGCLVKRIIGGFDLWGMKLSTGEEVDETINHAGSILSESIANRPSITVKADNGSNVALNDFKGAIRDEYSWDRDNLPKEENN